MVMLPVRRRQKRQPFAKELRMVNLTVPMVGTTIPHQIIGDLEPREFYLTCCPGTGGLLVGLSGRYWNWQRKDIDQIAVGNANNVVYATLKVCA